MRNRQDWSHKAVNVNEINLNTVASDYLRLIESNPAEEAVQQFIENHCYLMLQARNSNAHSALVSKPKLADEFVTDFAMFGGCNDYWVTFVEIEKPSDPIFSKSGDYSHAFAHSLRQIADWKAWIQENGSLFKTYFSRPFSIKFEIVIGRRENLKDSRHKLKAFESNITISTFDSLLPKGNFGLYTHDGRVQKYAVTFPEYKQIYNIGAGKESFVNPWFLYWEWSRE
jgi:hypothetical protein